MRLIDISSSHGAMALMPRVTVTEAGDSEGEIAACLAGEVVREQQGLPVAGKHEENGHKTGWQH
ncbi:hypothetical protein ACX12L_00810 [Alicycliphilus sp. T452]|jgi:hypothetical protein